jgi:hypothetical protein
MHLMAELFVLGGDDWGFLKKGTQDLSNDTNSASQLAN